MQCLRKLQTGKEFPLPPILHYSSSMEEHPVREKHKTVLLQGSNGFSLVHALRKHKFRKERREVCHPTGSQPCRLVVCPHELLGRFWILSWRWALSKSSTRLSLSSAATRNCTAVQDMISEAQFSVRKDIYRLEQVCGFPSTFIQTQCSMRIHDIHTPYTIRTQK